MLVVLRGGGILFKGWSGEFRLIPERDSRDGDGN